MKNYKLTGAVYGVEEKFYNWDVEKKYPRYEKIATVELGIYKFNNLTEAMDFFDKHYKHLQDGGCIVQVDDDGNKIAGGDLLIYCEKGLNFN